MEEMAFHSLIHLNSSSPPPPLPPLLLLHLNSSSPSPPLHLHLNSSLPLPPLLHLNSSTSFDVFHNQSLSNGFGEVSSKMVSH